MAAPLVAGADHNIMVPDTVGLVGAAGGWAAGVPEAEADQGLSPWVLPARTCTWYEVPLVSVAMVADSVALGVVSASSVQLAAVSQFDEQ